MTDVPDAPRPWYDRTLHTGRVAGLTYPCPECKRPMPATGNLFHHRGPYIPMWCVEYHCAPCDNTCRIWAPDREGLVDAIVRAETPEK